MDRRYIVSGIGGLKCMDEMSDHQQQKLESNSSVLGKRPLLSTSSFTITFNQNTDEEEGEVLMPRRGLESDLTSLQLRAKRGCATHPRSIAERNRRNRISERMRRLQQLFPNIDKQTSTAEMLDVALEHVRSLHIQVQKLRDAQANCKCS